MSDHHGRRPRRLRALQPDDLPADQTRDLPETAESVLPDVPRVGALDALLREVDSLRLSLETDLTLAASAVEAGAPQLAADIIDSDRAGLRAFETRALGHVAELARPKRRIRVPAAPFVAAAAVAGFLLGVVPHTQPTEEPGYTSSSLASPTESLDRLQTAAANGETTLALDAAADLHSQLLAVVANAKADPQAAATALELLQAERTTLALSGNDSLAVKNLLRESQHLSTLLLRALPPRIAAAVAPTATLPAYPVFTSPRPSSSPKATSSAKPKPKPSSSPSSAPRTSDPSPRPSSSPSSGPYLPGAPNLG